MKMLALGYWTIVIFAVFNSIGAASGQNEKKIFGAVDGTVSFGPDKLNFAVSIIWKQISSSGVVKAIEWHDDYGFNIPNPRFKGITELDRQTGQITISNLNADLNGVYTIDINSKEQEQRFNLEVLPPVPKPKIKIDRTDKYPDVVYLICEYSEQIIWNNSAGEKLVIFEHHPKGKFIFVTQNGNPESYYTCTLKNAVSEATSDPVYRRDLFEESVPWWISPIVLFILVIFLFCLLVLLFKNWQRFHAPVSKPEIQIDRSHKKPDVGFLKYTSTVKQSYGKKSAGETLKGSNHNPKGEFIIVKNKRNPDDYYTCTLKNTVSEKTSDPVYERDLFKS